MERNGFTVAVFNRTVQKVTDFVEGRAKGRNIIGAKSIQELVDSLKKPRKVMLMVKAGKPVDDFINQLIPLLEPGDIIIDGGNSISPIPFAGQRKWRRRSVICRHRRFRRRGRRFVAPAPYREAPKKHGPMLPLSSRRLLPRWPMVHPAVNGWARTEPAILSRWCTTASNMEICSSSVKPTTL